MQPITPSTPPALAKAIAEWLPDLEGRSIAVADVKTYRENKPRLPLAMVAFAGERAKPTQHIQKPPTIIETIVVEIWRASVRYELESGGESPFYAYIDYRRDRDVIIHGLSEFFTADGAILTYEGCSIMSDEHAYILEMTFSAEYIWCDPVPANEDFRVAEKGSITSCLVLSENFVG